MLPPCSPAMILRTFLVCAVLSLMFLLLPPGQALANDSEAVTTFETKAKQAILLDFETGTVLYAKNPDQPMAPSSMSKIMTVYMVFERLNDGRLSLEDMLPVSVKAWEKGGSKMFVPEGKKVSVEDLLRGVIVQSGNDASIVFAEGISGSEDAFARDMTRTGRQIGLQDSTFKNATGWPDPEHLMTARDLATLVVRTIKDFPEYYHYYAEDVFTYSGIKQRNRNPLLGKAAGADGLKTGHTEVGGYGLAASAERDGRRLVLVINGLESNAERARESRRLLEWGFREFANYQLFTAGETVTEASVWLGDTPYVPLIIDRQLTLSLPRSARQGIRVEVALTEPVPAPIEKGEALANMKILTDDRLVAEIPLKAGADVGDPGLFKRLNSAFGYLLWGGSF